MNKLVEKIGKSSLGRNMKRQELILIPKKQYILRVDEGFSDSERAEG